MNKTQVCLVFDDGFTASCHKIAQIFEARNFRATYAVLVKHDGFMPDFPKGDFDLWNELQERGHVIHPHGYDHTDLSKISLQEAVARIDLCLEMFSENLKNFDAANSVYHLTYNRSTPEVDAFLLKRFAAIRTTGIEGEVGSGMNLQDELDRRVYTCSWHGPDHCDTHLMETLKKAEDQRPEMMMYMLHGLDNEGWGPIHADALEKALDYIIASPDLEYNNLSKAFMSKAVT